MYAATIKYIGTTFALIAADRDSHLRNDVWGKIFASSSLGGWLDAADAVCKHSDAMPNNIKTYCRDYTQYRDHPHRATLDEVASHLADIVEALTKRGYKMERPKSVNLIRALRCIVGVRNKCAHGALDEIFFSHIERDFVTTLKTLLRLVPFSQFVFWGQSGGNAVEFLEYPPRHRPRSPPCYFWAESDLLSGRVARKIPFLLYRQDSRTIYFLNDKATEDKPDAEYIDYVTGQVVYRAVDHEWPLTRRQFHRSVNIAEYHEFATQLATIVLAWREIPLTKAAIDSSTNETGVYVFRTTTNLGGRTADVILYVGKTTNLRERLTSYLRIRKGYDDARPAITDMFTTYRESLTLSFAVVPASKLASVERAIYETTMPAYNMVAPPANGRERT